MGLEFEREDENEDIDDEVSRVLMPEKEPIEEAVRGTWDI